MDLGPKIGCSLRITISFNVENSRSWIVNIAITIEKNVTKSNSIFAVPFEALIFGYHHKYIASIDNYISKM